MDRNEIEARLHKLRADVPSMLPQGFEWRPHTNGEPALFAGGVMLAYVTETQAGTWRIGFLAKGTPHYHFMASREGAQRYVEAWARKWEAEIRGLPVCSPFPYMQGAPDPAQTAAAATNDNARRRGRKRPVPRALPS